jgi:mutator protein MutT
VSDRRIVVAAAVIERDSRYLVARRPRGTHLEGFWEFPGGKCEPGETHQTCLTREIREELGCSVTVGERLLAVTHDYPERTVELHFFRCTADDRPQPLLGQELRWVTRQELRTLEFPAADAELIELLER